VAGQEVAQELELEEACELAERSRRNEPVQAIVGEVDVDEVVGVDTACGALAEVGELIE
jgi:hypothetical protein